MKIKFTDERECCDPNQDFELYQGTRVAFGADLKFCKHCGQLWYAQKVTDAADSHYNRFTPQIKQTLDARNDVS